MIGRWLCRLGLHRWGFGSAFDPGDGCYTEVTYAWCNRKCCGQPMIIVDVEQHWKPSPDR